MGIGIMLAMILGALDFGDALLSVIHGVFLSKAQSTIKLYSGISDSPLKAAPPSVGIGVDMNFESSAPIVCA